MDTFKLNLQLEASDDDIAKIKMVANAGSVMNFGSKRYAIDVEGVFPHAESIPIVYGHELSAGIGHTTAIKAEDGKLLVEGVVSRETPYAKDFVSSARNGFPWQASVGGMIVDKLSLKKGESYNLHGQEIGEGVDIVTKFELFEISVVEFGADPNTSSIAAQAQVDDNTLLEGEQMNENDVELVEVDEIQASRERQAQELERVAEIKKRSNGDDFELQATAIREGWTPDRFELESLRAARPKAPAVHNPEPECDAEALEVVALRAAGFNPEKRYSDKTLTAADRLGALGLRDYLEKASGGRLDARRLDSPEAIRAEFSTQNLNYVLTRSVNAILLEAFNYTDNSWKKCFKIGRVNDFKKAERYRLDSAFELEPLTDGGKIKHGEIADAKFEVQAQTLATMFAITRKDIINDDLGALTDIPRQFGFGAADTINKYAWSTFMNPGNAIDGNAFYSTTYGSLKESTALTLDGLSAARAAFVSRKKQKATSKDAESPLGIPPTLLIVPTALEDKALMLTKATQLNNGTTADNPADYNPNYGRFQVVGVPFLGFSNYTGYSDTTWYLAADPNRIPAFEISFLNGKTAPTVERADAPFDTLGVQYRAYIDFGVSVQDRRGIMKVTAPNT